MAKHKFGEGRRRYLKEERTGGKWHPASKFTMREFIDDNAHDEWVLENLVPAIRALGVGESYVYEGGAAGTDRFTRIS